MALVVATLAVLVVPASFAPAGATETAITMSGFRDMIVDPGSGHVFVSGDSSVWVFDANGALLTTIPNVFGAGGMDIDGTTLYVAETTAAKIAKIDLGTLQVTGEITLGVPVTGASLAVIGTGIWFNSSTKLERWDLGLSTVAERGSAFANFEEIPGSTTTLLAYEMGYSPSTVYKLNIGVNPAASLGSVQVGSNLRQVAVNASNATFTSASGAPYLFPEFSYATMTANGVEYPGTNYPSAIAYSAGNGGVIAGSTQSSGKVYVAKPGTPISAAVLTLGHEQVDRALAISAGGTRVYALTGTNYGGATARWLETFDLAPSISSVVPTQVIADVPNVVAVTGTNLLGTTKVTVAGKVATFSEVTTGSMNVTMPMGLAVGARTMQITTPFGVASTSVTVLANTGATLSGKVSAGGTPRANVQLTLSGSAPGSPRTTTTGADGTYSFTALPYGADYALLAHDIAAAYPDQVITGLTLTPNGSVTTDVDLTSTPPPVGARLASTKLPITTPRGLVVVASSNRTFVSGDNEVDAFDHDGHLIGRITGLPTADGLTLDGTNLYVNERSAGKIVRIDTTTLAVTGTWPTTHPTTGGIAFAGGRLWFTNGNDQWVGISSLDPTTGTVTNSPGTWYVPRFQSIEGNANLFYAWEQGISSISGYIMNGSAATVSVLKSEWYRGYGTASASVNRVWTPGGGEYKLTDLTATGLTYPTGPGGTVAYSPARSGVLAFGSSISRFGTPAATHTLGDTPQLEAFDSGADRVIYVAGGKLVVWDLHPHVTAVGPAPIYTDASSLVIAGAGLRSTTSAKVDGQAVPSSGAQEGSLTLTVAGLAVGPHTVEVTTPFGTTAPFNFTVGVHPPVPDVTSLDPSSRPTAGGPVTIKGSGFTGATTVTFASVPVTFAVVDDQTINATVPPHVAATGVVKVWGPGGNNATSPSFTWEAPVPAVTSLTPDHGLVAGGTAVTINGSGFLYATAVTFGGTGASMTVVDDTTITATAPAHVQGGVPVIVTTAGGSSLASSATFTYQPAAPLATSVAPTSGSRNGGYVVTIYGSHLTGATGVTFGNTPAPNHTVVNDTTIIAVVPPGAVGAVTVSVTTAGGTTGGPSAPKFTFEFADVPAGAPFYADVMWAATEGITGGYPDGTFRPAEPMSRQAMAALLYRFKGSPNGAHPVCAAKPFSDVPVANPFCGEIAWLKESGITTGNADGTFNPTGAVSRQAMAAFLYRYLDSPIGAHPTCANGPFPDVAANNPFCGEITYLKAAKVVSGYADGGFHPSANVARQAIVAFLHRVAAL